MLAANTVTFTGSFGGTFLAPNAGVAVIRTSLPGTVVGAVVDALVGAPVALPWLWAGVDNSGAETAGCWTCWPDVTVTTTTCGAVDVQADAVNAREATRAVSPRARRLNRRKEPLRTVHLHFICPRFRARQDHRASGPATTVVVGREVAAKHALQRAPKTDAGSRTVAWPRRLAPARSRSTRSSSDRCTAHRNGRTLAGAPSHRIGHGNGNGNGNSQGAIATPTSTGSG